ncbi:hypothetical protein ABZP36_029441 [Zizania latifolia]
MDSDDDSDLHDHPPEFVIHAVDDLLPPCRAAALPPGIVFPPLPARPRKSRGFFFFLQIVIFLEMMFTLGWIIYDTVHSFAEKSIAHERSEMRHLCVFAIVLAVAWLLFSYMSWRGCCSD